jgi:tungstate transport system substrate-binding protein
MRRLLRLLCTTLLLLALPAQAAAAPVRLATTTSVEASGLLDVLLPRFAAETGHVVHVIAVGSGRALRLGREGDVDAVLVHDPEAEERFLAEGHGVLVGPSDDPAGIAGVDAVAALDRIAVERAVFVSRGDESGTHLMELRLWAQAGRKPDPRWYRESGRGMTQVLLMSSELDAYTLTDRGTWLLLRNRLPGLRVLVEGDPRLQNPYSVIAVNPTRHQVRHEAAQALVEWLASAEAQEIIDAFRLDGERAFFPHAGGH